MGELASKVVVLLSTFNGDKFLQEQLDSLFTQTYNNIYIYVRDDGSTDLTCDILKCFEDKYSNFEVVYGSNIGVVKSFMSLLKMVPADGSFVAFCDQDDIWLNDKVTRSVEKLKLLPAKEVGLYFSNYQLVDAELNYISIPMRTSKITNTTPILRATLNKATHFIKCVFWPNIFTSRVNIREE